MEIGIFWIPKTLTFKRRLRAKPFLLKCVLFEWDWKFIIMSMASHLASLWNRGMGQLRKAYCLEKVQKSCKNITFAALVSRLHRYPVVMSMKIQWHNFKRKLLRCIIYQIWCFSQPGFSLSNSNVDSLFTCLMWKMHLISLVLLISVVMSAVDCNNCCPELKIFNMCLWLNGFWRS